MKIIGLTLVRNESLIIQETLDHFGIFCTGGIYVIDDCSSDDTFEIVKNHKSVAYCERVSAGVHDPKKWSILQIAHRQRIYDVASQSAVAGDWFLLFDADERIEYNFTRLREYDECITCVYMKLFDFYITPSDVDASYEGDLTSLRKWLGPEYRPILFLFKHDPGRHWQWRSSRSPEVDYMRDVAIMQGYVRHYGKSISVSQWEETCDHYIANSPQFAAKWKERKGKAIHNISDFGYPLITWDEKDAYDINITRDGGTSQAELARLNWFGEKRLKLLVATNHLFDFTGSEITTLTIAEHLARWHNVTIHARYVSKEFITKIKDRGFIFIEELDSLPCDAFDVAYTQHHTSAFAVRAQFPRLPILHACLGVLPDLEQPPACDLAISAFLALSEEVRDNIIAKG
ncbi:MAG: glycosyltransferase family 2 protein, partial [Desulfovibrio sp.]|nr:glycosyltransferase family 2 protein [Desulfovibrio sp.]